MKNKRKTKLIIPGIAICVVLALMIVLFTGVIGVSAGNIENDARKSQKIDSTWDGTGTSNDKIAAYIFYDTGLEYHTFSVYINRGGFSFGYFFFEGGSSSIITNGIQMLIFGENGSVILSMNKDNVAKIVYGDGEDVAEIIVDPARPFAAVIPANCGSIALYNENGIELPITVIEQRS